MSNLATRAIEEIGKVIIGKDHIIRQAMTVWRFASGGAMRGRIDQHRGAIRMRQTALAVEIGRAHV